MAEMAEAEGLMMTVMEIFYKNSVEWLQRRPVSLRAMTRRWISLVPS
jgi:hypothetical protein